MASKLLNLVELVSVTGHTSLQMIKRYYHLKTVEFFRNLD
jgi:hypothetical protein